MSNTSNGDLGSQKTDIKLRLWPVALLAATLVTLFYVLGQFYASFFLSQTGGVLSKSATDWGAAGDFFGGILNPAISAMTAILVLLAYLSQRYEIRITQRELKEQAIHLAEQKNELSNQTSLQQQQLEEQRAFQKRQSFESIFFQLYSSLNRAIDGIKKDSQTIGRAAIEVYVTDFASRWQQTVRNNNAQQPYTARRADLQALSDEENRIKLFYQWFYTGDPAVASSSRLFDGSRNKLDPYFRIMRQIIELIDTSDIGNANKAVYANILSSQMSNLEMVLFFYHAIYTEDQNLKRFLERNSFFNGINTDLILVTSPFSGAIDHRGLLEPQAFDLNVVAQ